MNLLDTIFIIIIAHAGLAFLQSFKKGPSQYQNLLEIKIDGHSGKPSAGHSASGQPNVQELLDLELSKSGFCCKDLLVAVLIWSKLLRIIGFIPILLYSTYIMLSIWEPVFTKQTNVKLLSIISFSSALVLQVLYILLKLFSKIPQLLTRLHSEYKDSDFALILFDIKPLWKK
jgi:uncharacterized membrane protein YqaE (UPF0057 family)